MADAEEDLARLYDKNGHVKRIGTGKRIAAFFIDIAILLGTYFLLFYTAAVPSIKATASSSINEINVTYALHCDDHSYPYYKNEANFGFYEMDDAKYVASLREANPALNEEEAYDQYFDAYNALKKEVQSDKKYVSAYSAFQKWYLFFDMLAYLLPSLAFELIIPLFSKDRKTLSNMMLSLSRVNYSDGRIVKGYKVIISFLITFLIELFLLKVLLNYWSLLIMPLADLLLICALPGHPTLANLCSASRLSESNLVDRTPYPSKEEIDQENEKRQQENESRLRKLEKERKDRLYGTND
jgi:hypothetical protein